MKKSNKFNTVSSYHDIQGWCNFDEFYGEIIDGMKDKEVFVEVGTWLGRSLASFLTQMQAKNKKLKVYGVDLFGQSLDEKGLQEIVDEHGGSILEHFNFNMDSLGFANKFATIVCDSANASKRFEDGTVDVMFLDANHDENPAYNDIASWYPKMKHGGLMCGHDYSAGVRKAVDRFFGEHKLNVQPCSNSCWKVSIP